MLSNFPSYFTDLNENFTFSYMQLYEETSSFKLQTWLMYDMTGHQRQVSIYYAEIFCVPTCFHMNIPKPCLSVRTPRKEITLASSLSVLQY